MWRLLLPLLAFLPALSLATDGSRVFGLPPGALATARTVARTREGQAALKHLLAEADKALKVAPLSVMEKPQAPASGDKHDYASQAVYFWPNPKTPDGLPYIRKDGQHNPEAEGANDDSARFDKMAKTAETLGLAYALTRREDYAAHAARLLRVWFLDPATRMNPNCDYGQCVPGLHEGRGTSVIESRAIVPAMDAAGLLEGSRAWTKADRDGFAAWTGAFLTWMQTSPLGQKEAAAPNNHGTFCEEQIAHLALFAGRPEVAKQLLESAKEKRIGRQIEPDGSQPLELARADSFGYSRFNVEALAELAILGQHVGVDLWHYQAPNGASLRKAFDFILPYAEDPAKPWPYEHGKKADRDLGRVLLWFSAVFAEPRYVQALKKIPNRERLRDTLFFPVK